MSVVLGVDIGGSHITAALVNLDSRSVVEGSGKRKLVNSGAEAEEILDSWCCIISEVWDSHPASEKKIGIAMPGPFNYDEGISLIQDQDKFKSLYQLNVKKKLAGQLAIPQEAIRFMNDASCFLQGEVFCGAANRYNRVLGLTLGTGLGSAFCKDGIAEDADLWRSPFKEGIAEDYLSTRWFVGRYQELTGSEISGVKELMEAKEAADIRKQLFDEFSQNLALFLAPQIQKFNAEAVVFGGNISNTFSLFGPALKIKLLAAGLDVALERAVLNEDAALLGAASCWNTVAAENAVTAEPQVSRV